MRRARETSARQQDLLGLDRAEAFVDELDRNRERRPQPLGESLSAARRPTDLALGRQRQPEHDPLGVEFAHDRADRVQVTLAAVALDGRVGLSAQSETIGDGDANASTSEVDSDDPPGHFH